MEASVDGQPQQPCDGYQGAIQRTSRLTFKVCFLCWWRVAFWLVVWYLCGCW